MNVKSEHSGPTIEVIFVNRDFQILVLNYVTNYRVNIFFIRNPNEIEDDEFIRLHIKYTIVVIIQR